MKLKLKIESDLIKLGYLDFTKFLNRILDKFEDDIKDSYKEEYIERYFDKSPYYGEIIQEENSPGRTHTERIDSTELIRRLIDTSEGKIILITGENPQTVIRALKTTDGKILYKSKLVNDGLTITHDYVNHVINYQFEAIYEAEDFWENEILSRANKLD